MVSFGGFFGSFGLSWIFFSSCWGSLWLDVNHSWFFLRWMWITVDCFFCHCGPSWVVVSNFRLFWVVVDYFLGNRRLLLNFLGRCGLSWIVFYYFGVAVSHWTFLDHCESLWIVLDDYRFLSGLLRFVMDHCLLLWILVSTKLSAE